MADRKLKIGNALGQIVAAANICLVRMEREVALQALLTRDDDVPKRALAMSLEQIYKVAVSSILRVKWLKEIQQLVLPEEVLARWEVEDSIVLGDSNPEWKNHGSRIITGQVLYRKVRDHVDEQGKTLRVSVTLESFHRIDGVIDHKAPKVSVSGQLLGVPVTQLGDELPLCDLCGRPVDPRNDLRELEGIMYREPSSPHRHLLPEVEEGATVCAGSPNMSQYLEQPRSIGVPYRSDTERRVRAAYIELQRLHPGGLTAGPAERIYPSKAGKPENDQ